MIGQHGQNPDKHDPRRPIKIGQQIKLTTYGISELKRMGLGVRKPFTAETRGVFLGWARGPWPQCMRVRRDGLKSIEHFHWDYWEIV